LAAKYEEERFSLSSTIEEEDDPKMIERKERYAAEASIKQKKALKDDY
jgi:hypothetical protein